MKWIKVGSPEASRLMNLGCELLAYFDDDSICFFSDDWPFAECTHIARVTKPNTTTRKTKVVICKKN